MPRLYCDPFVFVFRSFIFTFGEDLVIKNNNKVGPHHTQEGGAFFTQQQFQNREFSKTVQNVEWRGNVSCGLIAVQLLLIKAPLDSLWASFQQKIL